MDYTTIDKRDYAWMAQASYLDFYGLAAYDNDGLDTRLKNTSSINKAKILADEGINNFV